MSEAAETVAPEAMVDPEIVQQIRGLRARRWGTKRIARELAISRNTVKRYIRGGDAAQVQVRPEGRALDAAQRERAVALFDEVAEGNAVVVHRELVREGADTSRGDRRCATAAHELLTRWLGWWMSRRNEIDRALRQPPNARQPARAC